MQKIARKRQPIALTVAAAPAPPRPGRGNPAMRLLASQYRTLPLDAKTRWGRAHDKTFAPLDINPPRAPHGNAWTAFYACNNALQSVQLPVVLLPAPVNVPQNLPLLTAQITLSSPAPSVVLRPDTAYAQGPLVAVWATAAVPQGSGASDPAKPFKHIPYRLLGVFDGGIPLAGLDVTAAYLAVFASVPASCKIGFKVLAINPGGWHSETAYTFGLSPMLTTVEAPPAPQVWPLTGKPVERGKGEEALKRGSVSPRLAGQAPALDAPAIMQSGENALAPNRRTQTLCRNRQPETLPGHLGAPVHPARRRAD